MQIQTVSKFYSDKGPKALPDKHTTKTRRDYQLHLVIYIYIEREIGRYRYIDMYIYIYMYVCM